MLKQQASIFRTKQGDLRMHITTGYFGVVRLMCLYVTGDFLTGLLIFTIINYKYCIFISVQVDSSTKPSVHIVT